MHGIPNPKRKRLMERREYNRRFYQLTLFNRKRYL